MPDLGTLVLATALLAGGSASASPVPVDPPAAGADRTVEPDGALDRRLDALAREIDRLRGGDGDWLTRARAEEIRRLVADVLADADLRASLLDTDATGGWDDGFFLASADGTFRLELSGQLQLRFVYNRQRGQADDGDRWGLENRRTKLKFKGHVLDPRLQYTVGGAFDDDGGSFELQDMTIAYALTDELRVRLGRFRSPLLREESVSSKRQLLVERSLIARTFDQERSVGVALQHETGRLRLFGAFMDASDDLFGDQTWLTSARAELLLAGRFSRLKYFTSFPGDDPTVALGAGILYLDDDPADPDDEDETVLRWTVDLSVELGGANLFAAIVGNHQDEEEADALDQYGVVLQGGVFLDEHWEVFLQYVWGDADGVDPDLSAGTIGVNRYFDGHRAKLTCDIGYGFNEVGGFWSSEGAGWREDAEGEDGQIVVRTQLQLLF